MCFMLHEEGKPIFQLLNLRFITFEKKNQNKHY